MYIRDVRGKQTVRVVPKQTTLKKGVSMKAKKVGVVAYRSRSAYAAMLLRRSKMSDSEIARKVGMTPQTVYAVKHRLMLKGLVG